MKSNVPSTIDMHMQFNSGGLEAMLEANGVAMEPSGAVLLTGQQLCPVTLLVTASYSASYCQLLLVTASHCTKRWTYGVHRFVSSMND